MIALRVDLDTVNGALATAIANRESSLQPVADLSSLTEEKRHRLLLTTKFVKEARLFVSDFPNESQVLKLERRVESLRDQIKQAERIANQHRAGIEAYLGRLQNNNADTQDLLKRAAAVIDETSRIIEPLVADEMGISGGISADESCDTLTSIAQDREIELKAKCELLERTRDEESELTHQLGVVNLVIEQTLPQVEHEKDLDSMEIKAEWIKEEQYLKSILERLYMVHKEQSFHLQRGTHIKKEQLKALSTDSEIVLSTRQSHLASEVNKGRAALHDLKEDLLQVKRQVDALRSKACEAQKEYDRVCETKELRLAAARQRHQKAVDESQMLRTTRAELQQELQELRDVPHITPRRHLRLH